MVLQIVLPEPNNQDANRHHQQHNKRASSRGDTRIYDINPGIAGAAIDPRSKPWYRGAVPPSGQQIAAAVAAATATGEHSFNSLCESRLGDDSLFSYGYGSCAKNIYQK